MSDNGPSHFDDPALKAALKQTWGGERAPVSLRQAIGEIAFDARPVPIRLPRFLRPLAAAAVLAVGVSCLAFQATKMRPSISMPKPWISLHAPLEEQLAVRHDTCAAATGHRLAGLIQTDFVQFKSQVTNALRISAVTEALGAGYKFQGASVCQLNDHVQAAHLLFKRGNEWLSIFSMPANVTADFKSGSRYQGMDGKHKMLGFVEDGNFYCVIGSDAPDTDCRDDARSAYQEIRATFPSALASAVQ